MNELYLVTGAAGHLGSTIVRKLVETGKSVRALVLPGEKNIPDGNIDVCFGDVCDIDSIKSFFQNSDNKKLIVIHCAGIVSIASKYQQKVFDVNVIGTKNIVNLCERYKVEKLVYVSSVHAIPEKPKGEAITEINNFNPNEVIGFYAKTKSEATSIVLAAAKRGLNANVVHPSGITGPFDSGRGHLTVLAIDYYKRKLTSGINGGYDFVDVRDVADGVIACCEKGKLGECYILSNQFYTVKEILFMFHEITGKKEIKRILPLWFIKLVAPLAETYYKILRQPPLFTAYSIYTLNTNAVFNNEKAKQELGFKTRNIKETLTDTINWLKEQHRI